MLLAGAAALMTWLTWRQLRVNAAVLYGAVLLLAAACALTGPHLADVYDRRASTFLEWIADQGSDTRLDLVGTVAGYVVPAVIGAFWGAPLIARELEAGTHRLVWTQSVTRTGWLASRLGLGMLGAVTASGALGLVLTWWAYPVDRAVNASGNTDYSNLFTLPRILPDVFASRGIAPIGYAAFAFALGVLAGAIVKRTVPAMAITLAAYVVLQIVMPNFVRPHLVTPEHHTTAITAETLRGFTGAGPNGIDALDIAFDVSGSWVLSSHTVDGEGTVLHTFPAWMTTCLPPPGTEQAKVGSREQACFDRLASEGYRQQVSYQPASHYWTLQWRETGLLLGGAALLSGACFWRVRRLS
jgi:hypothetical protein